MHKLASNNFISMFLFVLYQIFPVCKKWISDKNQQKVQFQNGKARKSIKATFDTIPFSRRYRLSEEEHKIFWRWSEELVQVWNFADIKIIWNWFIFRNFQRDCPNGLLDKKKVQEIYSQKINPNRDSKFLVDQLFRIIDDDNNGGIDFKVLRKSFSQNGQFTVTVNWWMIQCTKGKPRIFTLKFKSQTYT